MTDELPAEARDAFAAHEAFEADGSGYRLTTTDFDTTVTASEREDYATDFEVQIIVPTLKGAVVEGEVGDAVQQGWLETFERRLEDVTMATRASVELDGFAVESDEESVVVTYEFSYGDAERAAAIAKTFVEYVEGTYVEGVVPGYTYGEPVKTLLGAAATGNDGERGGTPL